MVVNKRKKVVKYRGGTTHGGGHRKKRRGAGSRGGRGRAGTGKRASHKVAGGMVITPKRGFRPRSTEKIINCVNVAYFTESRLQSLVLAGTAKNVDGKYIVNLTALNIQKLLGAGSLKCKVDVTVETFSAKAEEKIVKAGGQTNSATR